MAQGAVDAWGAGQRDGFEHADYLSITMCYARLIEQTILSCGITATQYRILFRLMGNEGSLRVGQLADMLDIGASAATGAVAQLSDCGAVIRIDSSQDRRGVHVLITDFGRHRAKVADEALRPVMESIRNDFPLDLRKYASICTLKVAGLKELFGSNESLRSVNAALCDEILLTATLVNHISHDEGLSLIEYRMLLDLLDRTDGAHPNEIAHRLGVRRNGIAAAQTELLRRKFIVRSRDTLDRRAVVVEITCDGFSVLQRAAIAMNEGLNNQILPNLTTDDLVKHRRLASQALQARGMA